MRNDLPISPNKKFKYSITFESWDEDSLEMGQTDERGFEVEETIDTIGDILYEANTTYGIYMPVSFGTWESTEPQEDRDFFEKGIRKYYALHIKNEDGTEISQEESDFIAFLLSDGRYEINKFRDYAFGGMVLGAFALGVGALITYFYFKGKKGNKGNNAKSVTHTINGKERKFPIKSAWKKEHSLENKSEDYEVPQEDRFEMGGDASEYYHEVEYGEGGVAKAKDVIMNKIGLNEGNADFLVSQSEKFAIWFADSILRKFMTANSENKKQTLDRINNHPDYIFRFYRREIREILDWLQHPVTPKQELKQLSFDQALEKAREWHQELQVLGGDIDFTEPKTNTIIKTYPKNSDGIEYYWVFIPSNYCDLESSRMGHCGRTGYGNNLISLRSVKQYGKGHTINDSHITIAYGVSDGIFYQIKGKKNNKPAEKYFSYIFDLIKTFITDNNVFIPSKNDTVFAFNGFGSEYGDNEDYGFEDMSNEELRELYDLKPTIFTDAESILAIFDAGVITIDEIKSINESNPTIFKSFGNKVELFDRGIVSERPSTIIEVQKDCEDVKDLLREDTEFRRDIVEDVLCGDTNELSDGWSYYYENPSDLIGRLNKENTEKVIDEIVRLTDLDKSVVTENGIEYYLTGEDEEFDTDTFDNIIRVLASAENSADNNDYSTYLYNRLKSSLEELGTVHSLNDEGVKMTIDLSSLMPDDEISDNMERYEFEDVSDLFSELIADNSLDLPRYNIDSRYSPYGSSEDFNDYVSDSDLESGYEKGGTLRTKNTNKKTKIKNMKPSKTKFESGGSLGVSKEDYFLVVQNWVYFTFDYPMGFVKDAFNSKHLEEKFSSLYERFGLNGLLMSFWADLNGDNREVLSLWIKNNYFNSVSKKTKLQSISDDDYAKIINHWNMFCFNFPYGFIENVYGDNSSNFEMKWVRAYESAGSTGAVNKFFTEMSSNNQMLLTDWVYDNYKGSKFADGGEAGENDAIEKLWNGYASAILFAEMDSDTEEPLDENYSISDFDEETVKSSKNLIRKFYVENKNAIEKSGIDLDTIGNDIWYTRAGHGAGFFDHNLDKEIENELTKGAEALGEFPSVETYDGKISVRGGRVFAEGGQANDDYFKVHGHYTISNLGGYEIELADSGDSARVRDAYGNDNPQISDWLEIEYVPNEDGDLDEDGEVELVPVIDPSGYNIPLNMVMRANYKKGGRLSDKATYLGKRDIESIKTVYGQTIAGEKLLDGNYVKGKLNKPTMSRTQFEEETYEYAEGGEVEDWMEEALASLIEETGFDDLEITIVSDNGNEFIASDDSVEYRVFKTEDDAEEVAVEQVSEDLRENPEYFNKDFLMGYIDGRDFFEEALNEMNSSYADDIESESDRKYSNRLISEMVDYGLIDDDDAESDDAEELASKYKDEFVSLMTENQLNEGNNGLDYFISNFGEEETYKMVTDNNLIDIDEASKEAVRIDGIGHFLSSYDGETLYLSDDCVAYRVN